MVCAHDLRDAVPKISSRAKVEERSPNTDDDVLAERGERNNTIKRRAERCHASFAELVASFGFLRRPRTLRTDRSREANINFGMATVKRDGSCCRTRWLPRLRSPRLPALPRDQTCGRQRYVEPIPERYCPS